MMRLPRFQYFAPRTLADAAALLAELARAGEARRRRHRPVAEHEAAAADADAGDRPARRSTTLHGVAGAPTTGFTRRRHDVAHRRRARRRARRAAWPALGRAARLISTPPLRNMGTLGGNLCLDTRCNYCNQSYEWRKSIDFCLSATAASAGWRRAARAAGRWPRRTPRRCCRRSAPRSPWSPSTASGASPCASCSATTASTI